MRSDSPLALLPVALAVMILSGCSRALPDTRTLPATAATVEPARRERLAEALRTLRPAEALLTHRVILSVGEREFDLNGRLAVSRGDGLRLLALVSMGQVMMDVRMTPDGEVTLMRDPLGMREGWIRNFVARDLRLLYQAPFGEGHKARTLEGGEFALTLPDERGREIRHVFTGDDPPRWVRSELIRGSTAYWIATPLAGGGAGDISVRDARHELILRTLEERRIDDPSRPGHRMFEPLRENLR